MSTKGLSLIDKKRRDATSGFIAKYADEVIEIVEDLYFNHDVRPSSRTILYRLKKGGVITKKDSKKVEHLVAYLKLTGQIGIYMMIDAKRSMFGTNTFESKEQALNNLAARYKLDLWENQDNKVLFMCEASGYVDVIAKVANEYRCDYLGAGGDISVHWKIKLALAKYTHIIYIGDMDDKGIEIPQTMIKDIHDLQQEKFTTMVRIEHDVDEYDTELENVDVEYIRGLLRDEVDDLIDQDQWDEDVEREDQDIEDLKNH